jgi:hypothetical protein
MVIPFVLPTVYKVVQVQLASYSCLAYFNESLFITCMSNINLESVLSVKVSTTNETLACT